MGKAFEKVVKYVDKTESQLLSKDYKNQLQVLKFKCSCGKEYEKSFKNFKRAKNKVCSACSEEKILAGLKTPYEEVKKHIESKGCSLLSEEYTNNQIKLKLKCACGEKFYKTYAKFKDRNETRCETCTKLLKRKAHQHNISYVRKLIEDKGNQLISKTYKNMREPLLIKCACGEEFETTLDIYKKGKDRCGICSAKTSSYELIVGEILNRKGLPYTKEKTFNECVDINVLPFDFCVEYNNSFFLIEVDGEQHFKPVEVFGGEEGFKKQKHRDGIKDAFCIENDIPLLRIPYNDIGSSETIIQNFLKTIKDNTEPSSAIR